MGTLAPTVSIDEQRTGVGRGGVPPRAGDGGDDGEFRYGSSYFETRLRRARLGLVVGLAGILMIFISFTSAYVVRQGLPTIDPRTSTLVRDWRAVPLPKLLFANTFVLIVSSFTMVLARRQVVREAALAQAASVPGISLGDREKFSWLALTVILGLTFLSGQLIAWGELAANGFYVATNPSSSFVYLLTGMHGVHLLGGILALLVACAASVLHRPIASRFVILDVTGWYWHFMAALWIYILCLLEFAP